MSYTHFTTSTRQCYPNVLHTSGLPGLKKNRLRSEFQNLKELIPIELSIDLIIQPPVRICSQISAKSVQKNFSPSDNLQFNPNEK